MTTKKPKNTLRPENLSVIFISDVPFNERKMEAYDDVGYGDAEYTLVKPRSLAQDRTMRKTEERAPTKEELADEYNLQPLAWELYKIAKKFPNVLIALHG